MLADGKTTKRSVHGMQKTRLYRIWQDMKKRCYSPKNKRYSCYGGRGIGVCKEWHDFPPFMEWSLAHGYHEDLTLDRIDVDKDYSPENCRWATMKEQQNNRSNNRLIEIDGVTRTAHEWADLYSVDYKAFHSRLQRGWDPKAALMMPDGINTGYHYVTYNGETHTIAEWSKITGIGAGTISYRLRSGWSIEKTITTPARKSVDGHYVT